MGLSLMFRANFVTGVLVGVAAVYVFHHFVSPLPGPNSAAKRAG